MLSFLVILALIQQPMGAPLPIYSLCNPSTVPPLLSTHDVDAVSCVQSDQRSMWDIVWGCFVTIFACTWIAVHPNIPGPDDHCWCALKRGLSTMICGLIGPEFITYWALKQYLGARQIMHKFNKEILKTENPSRMSFYQRLTKCIRRCLFRQAQCNESNDVEWTKTHGFFIQMGGFMLYKDGFPVEVLTYQSLKDLIDKGKVDIPRITERTINDKSKSDYLSKGFVVVQTTWFVVQCIARWAKSLPLAELEVVTLAFAILNAITYALWLNKPQNAKEGIRIDLKPAGVTERMEISDTRTYGTTVSSQCQITFPIPLSEPLSPNSQRPEQSDNTQGWLRCHLLKDYRHCRGSWAGLLWFITYHVPCRVATSALRPMKKLVIFDPREGPFMRVPMFGYHIPESPSLLQFYLFCLIGMSFGLVHVIAWNSGSTELETVLWRCSTLTITIEPLLFAVARRVKSPKILGSRTQVWDQFQFLLSTMAYLPFTVCLPAYVIARVALLVQSLASLRQLPPATFCQVDWTSFIPHL